ncbi:MAG: AarF/UbiB family protein [Desulfosarcinaceae bacterium]|nr:AarF/UbiB family protein [Desulfosarcinaceae bacterium]
MILNRSGIGGAKRFATITTVLARHGLGEIAQRLLRRSRKSELPAGTGYLTPVRLRRVLEELGPSFIKLGQLMSTRADVFPPEHIDELTKLQDSVPPVAFVQIRQVIERELKKPLHRAFAEFDETAMAAASVAQVHTARLIDGTKVAVKVIRPGITKMIRNDIRLMYYLARRIEGAFEVGRFLGVVNIVKEFERTIFRELDMFMEGGNIEKFAASFSEVDEIYIPKVYWECTTRAVLVMEHIDGIKMDQVEKIRANGIDPEDVAMIGLRSFSRQLLEVGTFHADPHPGNTIVMYDGRVSLVDFGITGYLDEETMLQIAYLFLGYAEHDYDMVIDALTEAGLIDPATIDLTSFRIDLKDMSEPFYGRALSTISVKDVYDQVMQVILKYRLRLPRNLMLLLKTFIQTEALGKILGSKASLLEVTRPYARKLLERGYDTQKILKNVGRDLRDVGAITRQLPRLTHEILKRTAAGDHRLEVRHNGLTELQPSVERGINRIIVGLIISASTIAGALILNSSQNVLVLSFNIFGGVSLSLTQLLGLMGYSIATILGFWLIWSIVRSGKL